MAMGNTQDPKPEDSLTKRGRSLTVDYSFGITFHYFFSFAYLFILPKMLSYIIVVKTTFCVTAQLDRFLNLHG